jgi:hypothetical protein
MAVPALRKGQYSTDGCNGSFAFKRRYTDSKTDSYCLVTISGGATFKNIPNGKYTDVVTGDVKNVTNGTLTANCSGKGNLRVYVLDTNLTKAPGKVGTDGKYIYGNSKVTSTQPAYDGKQEAGTSGAVGGGSSEPEVSIDPCVAKGEFAVFFQKPSDWGKSINVYIWQGSTPAVGAWPGAKMTNLGGGNYKITLSSDLTGYSFIFNDGSGKQTADLSSLKMSAMYNSSGRVVKTIAEGDCEAGEGAGSGTVTPKPEVPTPDTPSTPDSDSPSIAPGEQAVFFQAPSGWSSANCYVWYGSGDSDANRICGEWPGKPCENLGNGIFKYTFDKTIGQPEQWNIIFNNGSGGTGNQTADLVCKNATLYQMDGSTSTVGVEDVYAIGVEVYAYNRTIYVENAEGRVVTVRGLDGRVIYSGIDTVIPVANAGIYLVSVEDATLKIMVK